MALFCISIPLRVLEYVNQNRTRIIRVMRMPNISRYCTVLWLMYYGIQCGIVIRYCNYQYGMQRAAHRRLMEDNLLKSLNLVHL